MKPAPRVYDDAGRWSDDVISDVRAASPDELSAIAIRPPPPTWESEVQRLADETRDSLLGAFCTAFTHVVNTGEMPSYDEWADWARDELQSSLTGYPFDLEAYIQGKADQFAATLEVVQVNPALAREYVRRCRVLGL